MEHIGLKARKSLALERSLVDPILDICTSTIIDYSGIRSNQLEHHLLMH